MFIDLYIIYFQHLLTERPEEYVGQKKKKKTVLFLFEKYINNFTLPSLKEITSKTRDNILKNRQPATIKTWLHNQIHAKK